MRERRSWGWRNLWAGCGPIAGEAGGASADGEIRAQKTSKPVIYLKKWRKHAEFADLTAASW